jgi:hypothetical protein
VGFDPLCVASYEDVDFCRRLRNAGATLRYEPEALVAHDHRESLWSLPRKVWSYGAPSPTVGRADTPGRALRAFVRMHRRPHDQVRQAFRADAEAHRGTYLLVDCYLLVMSLVLFLAHAAMPTRVPGPRR